MKKLLTLISIATLALPLASFASTTAFTPATSAVTVGQTFSLTIIVTPQEAADYTAKIVLSFPADLVQVVSFTQASGWLPLSQPGYDMVDNTSGSLVKTGGYSGGFSSQKVFGTVTLRAVAAGTASISTSAGTQILDANNQNTFSTGGRASVAISAAVALPTVPVQRSTPNPGSTNPARTPLTPVKKEVKPAASATTAVAAATDTPATTTSAVTAESVAAVAGARTQDVSLVVAILSVVLAFGLGLFFGRRQKHII